MGDEPEIQGTQANAQLNTVSWDLSAGKMWELENKSVQISACFAISAGKTAIATDFELKQM